MVEKTLSEKCRDGEGTSPIDPFALLFQLQVPPPALVEGDLFGNIWAGSKLKDLFEGDVIVHYNFPLPGITRRAFGPLHGPVLITRYGYAHYQGIPEIIFKVFLSVDNDVSGPIAARGDSLFSKRLGFITDFAGGNQYPAMWAREFTEDYAEMYFDVNRVIRTSQFYVIIEIERDIGNPNVEAMMFLEIKYLNRPVKNIVDLLRLK